MATIILTSLLCHNVSAQRQETDAYFSALQSKQTPKPLPLTDKNGGDYIKPISVYLHDTVTTIRVEAYYLLGGLGQRVQQKNLRKKIVNLLIAGWHDPDRGISGMIDNALVRFQPADFDRTAIDSIKSRLQKLPASPGKLFKLIGYLQLRDEAPKIKSYVEDKEPPLKSPDRWAGYVALARMEDQHAIDVVLNRVRTLRLNDDVVYELFPDLIYTRTYRAIHYLEEILSANERSCYSPIADIRQRMPCAYRVMEMLAPVIKDYPIATTVGGDLATENYSQALDTIRAWFKQKNGTYEIIRETY